MFATATSFTRTAAAMLGTLVFAGACLFGAAGPAAADPAAKTAVVAYADLNLGSAAGRTALEARITRTATSVCANGSPDLAAQLAQDRCVKAAVAEAHRQLGIVTASAS